MKGTQRSSGVWLLRACAVQQQATITTSNNNKQQQEQQQEEATTSTSVEEAVNHLRGEQAGLGRFQVWLLGTSLLSTLEKQRFQETGR